MSQVAKIFWWTALFAALLACYKLRAASPPMPPQPKTPPSRLHAIQRATLVKKPIGGLTYTWDHYGPGPQFIYYEVDLASKMGGAVKTVLTTNTFYTLSNTVGPQMFVVDVRARDVALKNASKSLAK